MFRMARVDPAGFRMTKESTMSDGHSDAMKNLMATPGIERLKANIEACPDLGVDVEIYVQQRVAAAEQELADRAENPLRMIDGKVYDTRDVVKLLATEQKHAALVEAVKRFKEACDGTDIFEDWLIIEPAAEAMFTALAQQDQPAGEWITINEDGSNLPEHVDGAEWWCMNNAGFFGWRYRPQDWPAPSKPVRGREMIRAYWSVPHVPAPRPSIPEYTAR